MKVATILDNIDLGEIGLPEFQRGYVWKRKDVRLFMNSLYRGWPVGSLLEWNPPVSTVDVRGGSQKSEGTIRLLIDGQQRITTLYGISRGSAPRFFSGNPRNFLNLYFHLDTEEFEFYGPVKMKQDRRWISVTQLIQTDTGTILEELNEMGVSGDFRSDLNRLNQLERMFERDFHIEPISGLENSINVVVEIFNQVNSGGTELSEGDLALAKICAEWPQAREEMQKRLKTWGQAGFDRFQLDWFLRCINATLTGRSRFNALDEVSFEQFESGLKRTEKHINEILNQIKMQLGLDHASVLRSPTFLALISRYLDRNGSFNHGEEEIAKILFLYVNSFLWGHYSSSVDSVLQRDLNAIEVTGKWNSRIENLLSSFDEARSLSHVAPEAFSYSTRGTRFYPLLYMLSRVGKARDLFRNFLLNSRLIGSPLELHHIFPKSILYNSGYRKGEVNQLANYAFLVADTNRKISNSLPRDYLAECEARNPGVLASQWIPRDKKLWEIENFPDFLAARRELLAQETNKLLDMLYAGRLPIAGEPLNYEEGEKFSLPVHIASDAEEQSLLNCQDWIVQRGLPEGEFGFEMVDEETNELLVTLDLAWPHGLQKGLSKPIALLLDEDEEVPTLVQQRGFQYYTSVDEFKRYVEREFPE